MYWNRNRKRQKPVKARGLTVVCAGLIFFCQNCFWSYVLGSQGEMMEMGENSKLWLKQMEKMIGLRLRNAMLLNAILISAMFERKGSSRYQCVRLDWRFVPTITRRNVVVLLGRPSRMRHPCSQILISRSASWCWRFWEFHDRYKMDCYWLQIELQPLQIALTING